MGTDFSKFIPEIQNLIKKALSDDNKIDADEVRAMNLDKKVAIELMKQLSGNPEYIGDGFVRIKNKNTSLLSLDKVENDTIIPLDDKALTYYEKNYSGKDIKNGYYKDGKMFLLDSKGNFVKDEFDNIISEDIFIEEPQNINIVDFYLQHNNGNFDINKMLELQALQDRLNFTSPSDESYVQLKYDIEAQRLGMMSYEERKNYITNKMWNAFSTGDMSAWADALGEFYNYECEKIDDKLRVRQAKDFIKDKSHLNDLVAYMDKCINDKTDKLTFMEIVWELTKGVGDAIDSFIGAQGATMMAGFGIATKAATSLPMTASKFAPELISQNAASATGILIGGAIQAYFGTEGSVLIGSGIIDLTQAETKEQIRGAGAEIGLGAIMVHGAKKSTQKTFQELKLNEIKNNIKSKKHYTDVDKIEKEIRESDFSAEEKKELINECKKQTEKILNKYKKQMDELGKSKELQEKIIEVNKLLEELMASIKDDSIKNLVLNELEVLDKRNLPNINIYFEKQNIVDMIQIYKALKSKINEIQNESLRQELRQDLEERISSDSDMSLELRLQLAHNFYHYKLGHKTHSAALLDLLEYKYESNDKAIPIEYKESSIYRDLSVDIDKLDKIDELIDKMNKSETPKECNKLYEKYLQEETSANSKIIELCRKINNELGVKIILPGNLKEAGLALELVYKELYKFKMQAEANGEIVKLPSVLNFLTANIKFFENEYNKSDNSINNAFYDKSQNIINIRGLTVDSVRRLLRHELLHTNITEIKELPEGFKPNNYIDLLMEAGLSDKEIVSAIKNPGEFAIIAAEGNIEKYPADFKNLLVKLGLPKWVLKFNNTERQNIILTQESKKTRLSHIKSLLDSNRISQKESDIFYSSKAKQSPQAKLKAFIELRDKISNLLDDKTLLSTEEKKRLLQDANTIISDLTKYIEEKQENSVDYQICEDFRDGEIIELQALQEKFKYLDFVSSVITGCNDLLLLKNPNMEIKTLLKLFKNSPIDVNVTSRHANLNKYIEDYIKNYNISNKKHLVMERLENIFYYNGLNPLKLENVIAEKKDGRFITIRDLFGLKDNQELSVNQLKFIKSSKDLQDLIDNEFEHVETLSFGEIKFNNTENCNTFKLVMDSSTTFADTWRSVKYLFEQRLLGKGERMDAHASWELDYSSRNIRGNLRKEMNKIDWDGKALKTLYKSNPKYEALIIDLISNSANWVDNHGVTFFTSIHARTRFLERIILGGQIRNAGNLNAAYVQKMVQNFGESLHKDFVQNPTIFKHPSGHNPTVIINFNGLKYRVGLKADGSCATIIKKN